jgi:hypothetical protein
MSFTPPVRRLVPLCQVEQCAKPLRTPAERNYLWVREHAFDQQGREIVVCADCRAKHFNPPKPAA